MLTTKKIIPTEFRLGYNINSFFPIKLTNYNYLLNFHYYLYQLSFYFFKKYGIYFHPTKLLLLDTHEILYCYFILFNKFAKKIYWIKNRKLKRLVREKKEKKHNKLFQKSLHVGNLKKIHQILKLRSKKPKIKKLLNLVTLTTSWWTLTPLMFLKKNCFKKKKYKKNLFLFRLKQQLRYYKKTKTELFKFLIIKKKRIQLKKKFNFTIFFNYSLKKKKLQIKRNRLKVLKQLYFTKSLKKKQKKKSFKIRTYKKKKIKIKKRKIKQAKKQKFLLSYYFYLNFYKRLFINKNFFYKPVYNKTEKLIEPPVYQLTFEEFKRKQKNEFQYHNKKQQKKLSHTNLFIRESFKYGIKKFLKILKIHKNIKRKKKKKKKKFFWLEKKIYKLKKFRKKKRQKQIKIKFQKLKKIFKAKKIFQKKYLRRLKFAKKNLKLINFKKYNFKKILLVKNNETNKKTNIIALNLQKKTYFKFYTKVLFNNPIKLRTTRNIKKTLKKISTQFNSVRKPQFLFQKKLYNKFNYLFNLLTKKYFTENNLKFVLTPFTNIFVSNKNFKKEFLILHKRIKTVRVMKKNKFRFYTFVYLSLYHKNFFILLPYFKYYLLKKKKQKRFLYNIINIYRALFYYKRRQIYGIQFLMHGTFDRHGRTRKFLYLIGRFKISSITLPILFDWIDFSSKYGTISLKIWMIYRSQQFLTK